MEFLRLLEGIRTPVLDYFFSFITYLGSELVFLVLAVTIYWCVSKARGLYLLSIGCLGTVLNQALKITCRIPRPWVRDPSFTIVESARAGAAGYSFPSGHTQNAVGTFGSLARTSSSTAIRVVLILLAVLTAFSRMYLGVHTPMDVGVSAVIAVILVFAMFPLVSMVEKKPQRGIWLLLGLGAVNLLYLAYALFFPFPADADQALLAHGTENAAKLTGAIFGMALGYYLDQKAVHFQVQAPLGGQIAKVVLGLALLLLIKEGLKVMLGTTLWADALRYGVVTFFAAGLWPMTFPFFARSFCPRKKSD